MSRKPGFGYDEFRIKTDLKGEAFTSRKKVVIDFFSKKATFFQEDGDTVIFTFEHQAYEGAPGIDIKAMIKPENEKQETFIVKLERNGPGMSLHSYCQKYHHGKSVDKVFRPFFETLLKKKAKRHGSKASTEVEQPQLEESAVIGTA